MPHRKRAPTAPLLAVLLGTLLAAPAAGQQRRALDHAAYDRWNRIEDERLSPDGARVAYRLVPGDGDATLVVRRTDRADSVALPRGAEPRFSADSRWIVYRIAPRQEAVEEAERAKAKPDERPADSLAAVDVASGSAERAFAVANVTSFALPEEGSGWIAYRLEARERADSADTTAAGGAPREGGRTGGEDEEKEKDVEERGTPLVLRSLATGEARRFEDVTEYAFDRAGEGLFFAVRGEDGERDGVYRVDLGSGEATALATGEGAYLNLAVSRDGARVAYLSDRDDRSSDRPALALYVDGEAVVRDRAAGVPDGWWIARKGEVRFSDDGSRVYFGTRPRPAPKPNDGPGEAPDDEEEPLDEDRVRVDVWNWKDDYIMPMQLVRAEEERERAYTAVRWLDGGSVAQLGTDEVPEVELTDDGDAPYALGTTDVPYRKLLSWDGRYADAYAIDVRTGQRRRVAERVRGFRAARLSPEGRYAYWWDPLDKEWYVADVETGTARNVSAPIPVPVHDLFDDRPEPPNPAGDALWTEGDRALLVPDWYDLWLVDPSGRDAPRNVTEGLGRREGIRFRYARVDPEEEAIPMGGDVTLTAFHRTTKASGFYRDRLDGNRPPERLLLADARFGSPVKARDADVVLLTRETFRDFGDLHVTDRGFREPVRISHANPQQAEYRWGTAELVEWTSNDGIPLAGILYKPDGFDPARKYPMMVYFYERFSDGLHGYHLPSAGSSSISRSFYVSRGYLLFVPDIPYEEGHPGESALDAVVPGVLSIVDRGFVDPERIGVQGHSWGGYQIAYLVTRTNLFAAAEAGAPVVNMTSAYGGIRWQTGMVRQFQYERTQSRIGGSLWERPLEYVENSPLFQADKIRTPLLMMHNDEDGAVPWYQGIEMFAAMRRLGKPVWMLNYNGEPHGLRREANRRDWAVRMQQFFDHFLKDAPPPVWLERGVPATMKGETLGLDLVTEETTTTGRGPGP